MKPNIVAMFIWWLSSFFVWFKSESHHRNKSPKVPKWVFWYVVYFVNSSIYAPYIIIPIKYDIRYCLALNINIVQMGKIN
jgi:hypothetical protein